MARTFNYVTSVINNSHELFIFNNISYELFNIAVLVFVMCDTLVFHVAYSGGHSQFLALTVHGANDLSLRPCCNVCLLVVGVYSPFHSFCNLVVVGVHSPLHSFCNLLCHFLCRLHCCGCYRYVIQGVFGVFRDGDIYSVGLTVFCVVDASSLTFRDSRDSQQAKRTTALQNRRLNSCSPGAGC